MRRSEASLWEPPGKGGERQWVRAVGGVVGGVWGEVVRRFQGQKGGEGEGEGEGVAGKKGGAGGASTAAPGGEEKAQEEGEEEGEDDHDDPFATPASGARPAVSWLDIGERANGTLRCALGLRNRVAKNLEVRPSWLVWVVWVMAPRQTDD